MRPSIRALAGILAATLALGVAVAGSASAALPEFKRQNFSSQHVTFTGTSGRILIRANTGAEYGCNTSSMTGEIVSSTEVAKVVLTFTHGNGGLSDCMNFCQTSTGLWVTNELKGRIAYLSKSSKTVGLLLEPVSEPMTTCSHFGLSGAKVQKAVIGVIGPVNTIRKTPFELNYQGTGANQTWQHFEGEELIHNLQILPFGASSAEKFSLNGSMTLTMAKEIEIAA